MKRILTIALLFFTVLAASAQSLDSLDSFINRYVKSIESESIKTKSEECDFMIETVSDHDLKLHTALKLYSHYLNSKLMGDEAVAVHIAKKWILSGEVQMEDSVDLINIKVFVKFNESSLIGMQAPSLRLYDSSYGLLNYPSASAGRWSVIYFYDTSCSSCKIESVLLNKFASDYKGDIDIYCVYVGSNEDAWKEYREAKLNAPRIVHLWDPEARSDFQVKYGVLQTPMMMLVDPSGVIYGRKLDTESLIKLLEIVLRPYQYGSYDAYRLFGNIFERYGEYPSKEDVLEVASAIRQATLDKGKILEFKHMTGDFLIWLSTSETHGYHQAVLPYSEEILGMDCWTTREDSLYIVQPAKMLRDLHLRTPEGSKLPKIKVLASEIKGGKITAPKKVRLDRMKNSVIAFSLNACGSCEEFKPYLFELASKGKKVVIVDMIENDDNKQLLDALDLTLLPFVLKTDRKGRVIDKYLDANTL